MKSFHLLKILISAFSILVANHSHAQGISFEAFKISDMIISATLENTEKNILPAPQVRHFLHVTL